MIEDAIMYAMFSMVIPAAIGVASVSVAACLVGVLEVAAVAVHCIRTGARP